MASIKIFLRTDKINNKSEHPLYLRITKYRRSKYLSLGIYLKPDQWDEGNKSVKKSHPNAKRMNNFIATKVKEASDISLEMETKDKSTLPGKIRDKIMGKSPESFFQFAKRYLSELECKQKIASHRSKKAIIHKVEEYMKGQDLLFDQITVGWLKSYEQHLKAEYGNGVNTIHANFRTIRAMINLAIDEELITEDKNPFRRYKMTSQKVKKDYLTDEELMMIELAPLQKNSMKDLHRNMYVFSAYAGGLRISDILLLKWKDFDGERIIMQTKKTSSTVSIKVPEKALDILTIYRKVNSKPDDFIFPILKNEVDYSSPKHLYNALSSAAAYTNDDLREIVKIVGLEKKVSFHTARHSFATRALMKGMRIEYVSKLMGHSNIATTQIYAKIVNEELDKAMEVFN